MAGEGVICTVTCSHCKQPVDTMECALVCPQCGQVVIVLDRYPDKTYNHLCQHCGFFCGWGYITCGHGEEERIAIAIKKEGNNYGNKSDQSTCI